MIEIEVDAKVEGKGILSCFAESVGCRRLAQREEREDPE